MVIGIYDMYISWLRCCRYYDDWWDSFYWIGVASRLSRVYLCLVPMWAQCVDSLLCIYRCPKVQLIRAQVFCEGCDMYVFIQLWVIEYIIFENCVILWYISCLKIKVLKSFTRILTSHQINHYHSLVNIKTNTYIVISSSSKSK